METVSIDDEAGWYGVAGLQGNVGPVALYIEAIYRQMEATAKEEDGSSELDIDMDGIGFNLGVILGL